MVEHSEISATDYFSLGFTFFETPNLYGPTLCIKFRTAAKSSISYLFRYGYLKCHVLPEIGVPP